MNEDRIEQMKKYLKKLKNMYSRQFETRKSRVQRFEQVTHEANRSSKTCITPMKLLYIFYRTCTSKNVILVRVV